MKSISIKKNVIILSSGPMKLNLKLLFFCISIPLNKSKIEEIFLDPKIFGTLYNVNFVYRKVYCTANIKEAEM